MNYSKPKNREFTSKIGLEGPPSSSPPKSLTQANPATACEHQQSHSNQSEKEETFILIISFPKIISQQCQEFPDALRPDERIFAYRLTAVEHSWLTSFRIVYKVTIYIKFKYVLTFSNFRFTDWRFWSRFEPRESQIRESNLQSSRYWCSIALVNTENTIVSANKYRVITTVHACNTLKHSLKNRSWLQHVDSYILQTYHPTKALVMDVNLASNCKAWKIKVWSRYEIYTIRSHW